MFKEKEITQWIWDVIRTLWANDESSPTTTGAFFPLEEDEDGKLAIDIFWEPGAGTKHRDDMVQAPSNPDYALSIGLKYISKNSDRDCWISPKGCEDCSLASEGDAPLFARLLHKDYLRVKRTQKKGGE